MLYGQKPLCQSRALLSCIHRVRVFADAELYPVYQVVIIFVYFLCARQSKLVFPILYRFHSPLLAQPTEPKRIYYHQSASAMPPKKDAPKPKASSAKLVEDKASISLSHALRNYR